MVGELRTYLAARLPDYMVPAAFVLLDALPLTSNGKLDLRALPAPAALRPELAPGYVAPRTPAEQALAAIWQQVLGVARVGIDDSFFALGGDSILSIRLLALAQQRGLRFSLQQLFQQQTISGLSRVMGGESSADAVREASQPFALIAAADRQKLPAGVEDAYPLTELQAGMLFHSLYSPERAVYQNVSSFRLRAPFDQTRLQQAIAQLVARHAVLRTAFDLSSFSEPLQLVYRSIPTPFQAEDLRQASPDEQERILAAWFEAEQQRQFDWTKPGLLRLTVHRRDDAGFQLTLTEHHAILDGWSVASMLTDLFTIYFSLLGQTAAPTAPPAVSFGDFVALERQALASDADRGYWRQALSSSTVARLPRWPADTPTAPGRAARQQTALLSLETSDGLRDMAQASGVPLKSALLAAHLKVIGLLSGQTDVLTGLVAHGRLEQADGERVLGLFLNTVPFRVRLSGGTWLDLVRATFAAEQALLPFRRYPMAAIQRDLGGQPLFETAFNFINFHIYQGVLGFPGVEIVETNVFQENNFPLTANFDLAPGTSQVRLSLDCDTSVLFPEQISAICGYYVRTLTAMARAPLGRYEAIDLLSAQERQQQLLDWNATEAAYPHQCVHQLFAAQAARTPDAVAVVCDFRDKQTSRQADKERTRDQGSGIRDQNNRMPAPDPRPPTPDPWYLTYGELDRRANQLAQHLRALGVGPEVRVGICLERSLDLMIGLMAIFKAGGAFVPIDPAFPTERIAFMLDDSQVKVLITTSIYDLRLTIDDLDASQTPIVNRKSKIVNLSVDWPLILQERADAPNSGVSADNLAYLIYTSGSTGRPKGVLIPHCGLVNYLVWCLDAYTVAAGRGAPIQSTIAADAIFPSLFAPLLVGTSVILLPEESPLIALQNALQTTGGFSMIKITPTQLELLNQLLPQVDASGWVRTLVVGAEALRGEVLDFWQRHAPDTILLNEYGPTETVVGCSIQRVAAPIAGAVPIGMPIANTQFYVLDAYLQPVPVGTVGELFIGGAGVAWGYLNRPDLTAERFVPNPFADFGFWILDFGLDPIQNPKSKIQNGTRLYKTGDQARYRPDGAVEFLGRLDQQIKLHGYRIELGEIESVLSRHPAVQTSVVTLYERTASDKRLVAYVVTTKDDRRKTIDDRRDSASSSIVHRPSSILSELRSYLAAHLPVYMQPTTFVLLDALPLMTNGKLDRAALPAPAQERPAAASYRAPRTAIEQQLAQIWAQVLGVARVGIDDSFFALGGDSILSIQIIAKARQVGLQLTPRQLFQQQTIAALAPLVGQATSPSTTGPDVRGPVALTPIQRWFFAQQPPDPHHFNQALLLTIRRPVALPQIARALQQLIQHHDALNLRFEATATGWQQRAVTPNGAPPLTLIDLRALTPAQRSHTLRAAADALQASLDLARGPLLRVAYVASGQPQADRLLLIIHHLVVDGVSWRILLDDLQTAYQQLALGQPIALPPATSAFQHWAARLPDYANSAALHQELPFWRDQLPDALPPLPLDFPVTPDANRMAAQRSVTVALSRAATQALLHDVPAAYHSQINDVLLTALAQTFARWTDQPTLVLDLEGHGREEVFADLDLSRTVGWFTSLFPLRLTLPPDADAGAALMAIKEQLRAVPQRGIGYGLLRYLDATDATAALRAQPAPLLSFNYLGQTDQAIPVDAPFGPAAEESGATRSPRQRRPHLLAISAMVTGGQLRLEWSYSAQLHQAATITRLAQDFLTALERLIAHCLAQTLARYTPADFPLARLDQPTLDRLARANPQLEDVYPTTELQAGMLFHSLYSPESAIYHNVLSIWLRAPFDAAALGEAVGRLVARHPLLRTAFDLQSAGTPLQLVHRHAPVALRIVDLRAIAPAAQTRTLADFLAAEQRRHFDWTQPGLLRFTIHQRSDDSFQLSLTEHHAILDGWSVATLLTELFTLYFHVRAGTVAALVPAPANQFRTFVALEQQARDSSADRAYWQDRLRDHTRTLLPRDPQTTSALRTIRQRTVALPPAVSAGLRQLAQQAAVPLRSVLLGAHLRVLSLASGQADVLTGLGVNGRLDEADAERALGLFFNTVPLRLRLDGGSWSALMQQTFAAEQELLPFSRYPLALIQRDQGGQALFDSAFNFVHFHVYQGVLALPGVEVLATQAHQETNFTLVANFEQDLATAETRLMLDYDPQVLTEAWIERLAAYYARTLRAMAIDPAARYETAALLGAHERQQLLIEWNATAAPYPATTVAELFAAQAARTPDAIALIFEGSGVRGQGSGVSSEQLSYDALNRRANQLAQYLQLLGVGPDVRVGLELARTPALIVALLGVFKAGGAYVPLDPAYPTERLAFMREDAGVRVLITTNLQDKETRRQGDKESDHLPVSLSPDLLVSRTLVDLHADWPQIARQPDHAPSCATNIDHLAYVIYTSGSTGRPKGVMVAQRGLGNWAAAMQRYCAVGPGSRVLQFASFSFDASITEVLLALLSGATLCIGLHATALVGPALQQCLHDQAITLAILPPSALATLPPTPLPALRDLIVAGEACPPDLLARWSVGRRFINAYGPTEATVCATMHTCAGDEHTPPIGQPIANAQVYLLDQQRQPVPVGVPGELFIGGLGLARGYLNRPDLTAERFVPNPFSDCRLQIADCRLPQSTICNLQSAIGTRLYRTGDLARYRPDGAIEFLGRIDQQVKLRGYRIELDEIMAVLRSHPAVQSCVVITRADLPGDARLVAYVVPATDDRRRTIDDWGDSEPSSIIYRPSSIVTELRTYLAARLPAYMLPSAFVLLGALPLTPSGKVDRRALPVPDQGWLDQQRSFVAPRTPVEAELARIWAEVLGLAQVSVHDSFFDLGGHSLLATQIFFQLRATFDVELPLSRLFATPTVAELAEAITTARAEQEEREQAELMAMLAELSEEDALRELMKRKDSAE